MSANGIAIPSILANLRRLSEMAEDAHAAFPRLVPTKDITITTTTTGPSSPGKPEELLPAPPMSPLTPDRTKAQRHAKFQEDLVKSKTRKARREAEREKTGGPKTRNEVKWEAKKKTDEEQKVAKEREK